MSLKLETESTVSWFIKFLASVSPHDAHVRWTEHCDFNYSFRHVVTGGCWIAAEWGYVERRRCRKSITKRSFTLTPRAVMVLIIIPIILITHSLNASSLNKSQNHTMRMHDSELRSPKIISISCILEDIIINISQYHRSTSSSSLPYSHSYLTDNDSYS